MPHPQDDGFTEHDSVDDVLPVNGAAISPASSAAQSHSTQHTARSTQHAARSTQRHTNPAFRLRQDHTATREPESFRQAFVR